MKRLFFTLFGAIVAAIATYFWMQKRVDALQTETARLQKIEQKWNDMNTAMNEMTEDVKKGRKKQIAKLPLEKRLDYEFDDAINRSYSKPLDEDEEDDDA